MTTFYYRRKLVGSHAPWSAWIKSKGSFSSLEIADLFHSPDIVEITLIDVGGNLYYQYRREIHLQGFLVEEEDDSVGF